MHAPQYVKKLDLKFVGGDAYIAPSKILQFKNLLGEFVTFLKGPMWASAPTRKHFDSLFGYCKILLSRGLLPGISQYGF